MTIGDKIKKLRIARQMTQQEVCGDFITRNMLSRIENNSAMPSVQTIEYIAQQLGVPVGELFGDAQPPAPGDDAPFRALLEQLRQAESRAAGEAVFSEYLARCNESVMLEAFLYESCLAGIGGDELLAAARTLVRDPAKKAHLDALFAMQNGDDAKAAALLRAVHTDDAAVQDRVWTDLEQCCLRLNDYEGAYRCAAARRTLLEGSS